MDDLVDLFQVIGLETLAIEERVSEQIDQLDTDLEPELRHIVTLLRRQLGEHLSVTTQLCLLLSFRNIFLEVLTHIHCTTQAQSKLAQIRVRSAHRILVFDFFFLGHATTQLGYFFQPYYNYYFHICRNIFIQLVSHDRPPHIETCLTKFFYYLQIIIIKKLCLMGSFRSQPDLTKHTYEMFSLDHSYAVTHMCGWRKYMEDASMIISPFTFRNYSLFGVFDGHGGPEVALYAQKHFPELLQKNQNFKTAKFQEALKETFINLDHLLASPTGKQQISEIRKTQVEKNNSSEEGSLTRIGCTCLVILVTKDAIYVANAGDCRAVAVTYSGSVKQITKDHKPHDADEQARIIKAGGHVDNGRVNGCLNLSRALGDLDFKTNKDLSIEEQAITCLPDVIKLSRDDLFFIVMCCDGVWECRSNESMAQWIKKHLQDRISLTKTLQGLFDQIVARDVKNEHGTDNMSAILIKFDKTHNPHSHSHSPYSHSSTSSHGESSSSQPHSSHSYSPHPRKNYY